MTSLTFFVSFEAPTIKWCEYGLALGMEFGYGWVSFTLVNNCSKSTLKTVFFTLIRYLLTILVRLFQKIVKSLVVYLFKVSNKDTRATFKFF